MRFSRTNPAASARPAASAPPNARATDQASSGDRGALLAGRLSQVMRDASICGLGQAAPNRWTAWSATSRTSWSAAEQTGRPDPVQPQWPGRRRDAPETIPRVAKRQRVRIPAPLLRQRPGPTATAAPAWSRSRANAPWRPVHAPHARHAGDDRPRPRRGGADRGAGAAGQHAGGTSRSTRFELVLGRSPEAPQRPAGQVGAVARTSRTRPSR